MANPSLKCQGQEVYFIVHDVPFQLLNGSTVDNEIGYFRVPIECACFRSFFESSQTP